MNPEKQAHFDRALSQYTNRPAAKTVVEDLRPTSGNVGQKCMGYFTDARGRLVRIVEEGRAVEFLGPGTYNPYKYERKKKKTSIHHSSRTDFTKSATSPKVGPADYVQSKNETKYKVTIKTKWPPNYGVSCKSGNLKHESWIKRASTPIPKNRFPQTNFDKSNNTRPFHSKDKRELFPPPSDFPDPTAHQPPDPELERTPEASSIFRNRLERFSDAADGPGPGSYNAPAGDPGPSFGWEPLMEPIEKEVVQTPAVGQYEPYRREERKLPQTPEFRSRVPRERRLEERAPPVGQYGDPAAPLSETAPRVIRSRRPKGGWDEAEETPGPGRYEAAPVGRARGGSVIGTTAHEMVPKRDRHVDSHLAFTTLHDGLIKRSYNAHYNANLRQRFVNPI